MSKKFVSLSADWEQFEVRFDELGVDSRAVSSIDFLINGRAEPIDLWLDDLGFLCRGDCP